MEGRITTPPTMSGVQKRARQGEAEGISRPDKAKPCISETCGVKRLPSKVLEKHTVNAYGGNATARRGRKGIWMQTNNKHEVGDVIFSTSSQPFAGTGRSCLTKSCKADQQEVKALEMACCTADPCLGGI
jgi:hypothetical protein